MNLLATFFALFALAVYYCEAQQKVVCYFDSRSHLREGQGKFTISDIEPALVYCTHLVYGFAAINEETFKITPLNEQFDVTKDHYRQVTNLKQRHPKLKVLLSVGGQADVSGDAADKNLKYRTLLEDSTHRLSFINSAYTLIKGFGFDGIDLAWEFPENKPKKIRSTLGSIWHTVKKPFSSGVVDANAEDHREQFVSLVREMKNALRAENLLLSVSVLPNVNSTVYYNPKLLAPYVDFVNLWAFDFFTPERNPKEADYPSPLYELDGRRPDENIDAQVRFWMNNGAPVSKLVLGLPTYGRTWAMDDESDLNGLPPLHIAGPGEQGSYTKDAGLLSYPELCMLIGKTQTIQSTKTTGRTTPTPSATTFIKIADSSKRKGTFAFKLADENNNGGMWIAYEDEDTAMYKANYVKAKGLGGVAIIDLSLDDFGGTCGREKYDILKAAASHL